MIFVSLGLLGFGVGDLVRWSPGCVEKRRAVLAAISSTAAVALVAALSGMGAKAVLLSSVLAFAALLSWSLYDSSPSNQAKPEYALGFMILVLAVLFAASGSAGRVQGDLATWYSHLDFRFVEDISVDQFLLGVGALLFLTVSGNRLVRFTLAAAEISLLESESSLRGGRVLGPMERLMVAAAVISGSLAGAGFVVAAKGLLRFREIRSDGSQSPGVDEVTEYFLIGTFASVLVAASLGLLVSASI